MQEVQRAASSSPLPFFPGRKESDLAGSLSLQGWQFCIDAPVVMGWLP
jgi:hypothetical protein